MTTRVLIVDDSAIVRKVLTDVLDNATGIVVMGAVQDPLFAMKRLEKEKPDVIVLDVEMPRMDGITFLKKIMNENPLPVVMCSTLTAKGSRTGLQALSLGAVDVVEKPKVDLRNKLGDSSKMIIDAVRSAASANIKQLKKQVSRPAAPAVIAPKLTADAVLSKAVGSSRIISEKIIAIGTSTGGTQALEVVLPALAKDCPGVVVVQHMPEAFTAAFSERLNSISQVEVLEGKTDMEVTVGRVIIAPGGKHMMIERRGNSAFVVVKDGPLVSRHRPSVDVLFRSVAKAVGKNALGIIMTGMGDDGAKGLKEMHDTGAYTIAQDEESCIVYGMPAVAVKIGAVDKQCPLQKIAESMAVFGKARMAKAAG